VHNQISCVIEEKIRDQVHVEVEAQVYIQIWDSVSEQVWNQLHFEYDLGAFEYE
jgi:hypothetical protein